MNTAEMMDTLEKMAKKDGQLRQKLLGTRNAADPLDDFCRIARENGLELYPFDLVSAGEEAYAAIRRSTNGGGENSPLLDGEDDWYELFLAQLR